MIRIAAAVISLLASIHALAEPSLDWLNATRSDHYLAPEPAQLELAETLWRQLLHEGQFDPDQHAAWRSLGFEALANGPVVAFRESGDQPRGWGAYVLRLDATEPLLIQAPHRYHDRSTGQIAWLGWRQRRPVGLALNSTPRASIDLAKQGHSMMMAFTRALWAERPDLRIVQVHGFAAEKRQALAARESEVVLSAGHRRPRKLHQQGIGCLVEHGFKAALFPVDTNELGGTQNEIARALRRDGFDRFIHLELSAGLRQELIEDEDRIRLLWTCL